jgi:hypothetical protein
VNIFIKTIASSIKAANEVELALAKHRQMWESEFLTEKENNMIKEFEVGKYYKWVGPKERQRAWHSAGEMDYMLDGRPHLCTGGGTTCASFEEDHDGYYWSWEDGIEHIVECTPDSTPSTLNIDSLIKKPKILLNQNN